MLKKEKQTHIFEKERLSKRVGCSPTEHFTNFEIIEEFYEDPKYQPILRLKSGKCSAGRLLL